MDKTSGKEDDVFHNSSPDAAGVLTNALVNTAADFVRMSANPLSYVPTDMLPFYRMMYPWLAHP